MHSFKLSLIPLKISVMTTFIFIVCLAYLNITISEKYRVQIENTVEANQRGVLNFVGQKLHQKSYNYSDLGMLFEKFEEEKDTVYFGVYRVDVIDAYTGIIMASSVNAEISRQLNPSILNVIKRGKNNQAITLEGGDEDKNVELFFRNFPRTDNFVPLTLVVLHDMEASQIKTRDFSLLLFIISFFAALIIFFSVFLISGKLSMNIKQMINAVDNLLVDVFEIQIPKSNDELGELGNKITDLKNVLAGKTEKIHKLEQSTQVLKDKKFEVKKVEYSSINGLFCRISLSRIQDKLGNLKPEVRNEFLLSIIELFQDNVIKADGKILNFDGVDFLLFYDEKISAAKAIENLLRIKKNLQVYSSQYDILSKFELGFSVSLIRGEAVVGRLSSGSLNFKTVIGKTIAHLDKISQSAGTDDILIATTEDAELKKQFALKPLKHPLKDIPENLRMFYLNDGDTNFKERHSDKPTKNDPLEYVPPREDPNSLSAMLEDTLNQ